MIKSQHSEGPSPDVAGPGPLALPVERVVGVLLAGGQSRRMFAGGPGQGDKGILEIAGKPMLAHVIGRLQPQVRALVINANGAPERFARFGLPVVPDTVPGYAGPLAGVLAGMRWAQSLNRDVTHIVTASTDAPFLPSDLVARLSLAAAETGSQKQIALARSEGHLHPVIGLWPIGLADDLMEALNQGVRKVLAWTDRHGTLGVDFPFAVIGGIEVDPFFNANTPEELEQARHLVSRTMEEP